MMVRSVIIGTGSALPARRVSNAELAQTVDTSDEWIVERTGIRFRHIASPEETTATLAADAGRAAIAAAGVAAQDVDLIVLRSEERRGGKEGGSTGSSRWLPVH